MRSIGITDLFAAASDAVVLLFAVLTQLGDPWFIFVLLALFYWLAVDRLADDPRRTGALLVALSIGALLLTVALKSVFALPRPPGADTVTVPQWLPLFVVPVFENIATGTGFGFPSGHAIGTTVTYCGLAALLDVWNRTRRWLLGGVLVILVSLSRLVLGVHYAVDVVVGALVGLLFLGGTLRLAKGRPDRAFAVAAAVGLVAIVVTTTRGHPVELREAATGLGAALGGFIAWRVVGATDEPVPPAWAAVGLLLYGGLWVGARSLHLPLVILPLVYAVVVAGLVAHPVLVATVRGRR